MQNTNILPYKRLFKKDEKKEIKQNFIDHLPNLFMLTFLGFFLGRATIFETLLPFGIAYFSVIMMNKKIYSIAGIGILAGIMTLNGINILKYIISFMLVFLLEVLFKLKTKNIIKVSLSVFISLFLSGILFSYTYGFLTFDIIMSFYEAVTSALMVFVFANSVSFLLTKNRKIISNEEIISIFIFLGLVVLGLNHIIIWRFNLNITFGILIILFSSYFGGVSAGASVGTAIGLLGSLSTLQTPAAIGIYSFAGLLSGSLKKLNKIGIILGFITAVMITAFYITASINFPINYYDVILASGIFMVMPRKYVDKFNEYIRGNKIFNERNYNEKLKEVVTDKLKEYSRVFDELGKSFKEVNDKVLDHKDVSYLFEEIANKVCTDCVMYRTCWDKDFYQTYKSMFEMVESLEGNGKIETNRLYKKCIKFPELINATKYNLNIYKINMQWRERLKDAKGLIANQLKGISDAISNMAEDISMDISFKDELEQLVMVEMDKRGAPVDDVIIYDSGDGNINIKIYKKACYAIKECDKKIIPIISEIMGEKYERKSNICSIDHKGRCSIKLSRAEKFNVSTGISKISKTKNKVSGDSYSFMELEGGKYMAALSDGMGFGYKAASESGTTISLLEKFIEAGFDKHLIIQTLNSILALRSAEEMFSTVDIMFLDQFTGEAEFIKIGSSATFIKTANDVEIIESSSLPIGILEDIDADIHERKLKDGDFVILTTDGVLECFEKDKEFNFSKLLKSISTRNPQDMAELIMKEILKECNNEPKDDMTVLVSKVWKKY